MAEARPRMIRAELEYLVEVLKDREEALKGLYERLIRTIVFAASGEPRWREVVFHNYEFYGQRALTFFRSGSRSAAKALDNELRKNETVLESLNRAVWCAKGLRARFESLLKGKKKGRISTESEMARIFLAQRKH